MRSFDARSLSTRASLCASTAQVRVRIRAHVSGKIRVQARAHMRISVSCSKATLKKEMRNPRPKTSVRLHKCFRKD